MLQAGLVDADGVVNRSPYEIRKAVGGFMAKAGASVCEIMAVHGHSSPQTSEIYTKGASRAKLGAAGLPGCVRMPGKMGRHHWSSWEQFSHLSHSVRKDPLGTFSNS